MILRIGAWQFAGIGNLLGFIDQYAAVHRCVALFILTGVVLGIGLSIATLWRARFGAQLRSYILQTSLTATLALALAYLVISGYAGGWSEPITTTAPPARPILSAMHPLLDVQTVRPGESIGLGFPARYLTPENVAGRFSLGTVGSVGKTVTAVERGEPFSWLDLAILSVWLIMLVTCFMRQMMARRIVDGIRARSITVSDEHITQLLATQCRTLGVRPLPALRSSSEVDSPFTAGITRPFIVLPENFSTAYTAADLEAALTHELAHIVRRDHVVLLAADAACALLWFQPLVCRLRRELIATAEEACDAIVLTKSACKPKAYAALLLQIAEGRMNMATERVAGVGLMPDRSDVSRRVRAILSGVDLRLAAGTRLGRIALTSGLTLAVLCLFAPCVIAYVTPSNLPFASRPGWRAPAGYFNAFKRAQQNGWSIGEISVPANIDTKPISYRSPVPAVDRSTIDLLNGIQPNGVTPGAENPSPAYRKQLESVLADHPHCFYAEYLLSVWYAQTHDAAKAEQWLQSSLDDAPEIIAGRVQYENGRPIQNYVLGMTLSYPTQSLGPDSSDQRLNYTWVRTDPNGCYYLPSYRGVTNLMSDNGFGNPIGDYSVFEIGGGSGSVFAAEKRVGVVSPYIARPSIRLELAGDQSSIALDNGMPAVAVHGQAIKISWRPIPEVKKYRVWIGESWMITASMGIQPPITRHSGSYEETNQNSCTLALSGGWPGFLRKRSYDVVVYGDDADGNPMTVSKTISFTVPDAPLALPLDRATVQTAVGEGGSVQAVRRDNERAVIVLETQSPNDLDFWLQRRLFGYPNYSRHIDPVAGGRYRATVVLSGKLSADVKQEMASSLD